MAGKSWKSLLLDWERRADKGGINPESAGLDASANY